ncbi:type II toxin-antitoxin system VapC family toxin [bacterium]|nr:type II toxin-antitoxin system VapC family toxin [bacterium]MCI0618642.1 type II toxin-antitoxin system VapC family toxin [bacterium]
MEISEVVLLDTHAFVWWISSPQKLSKRARQRVDTAANQSAIYVSSISIWEIVLLVSRGRLEFSVDVEDWINLCESLPILNFVPVDNHVAIKANRLPKPFHPDPADRMILATALILNATLITGDDKILNYPHVKSFW